MKINHSEEDLGNLWELIKNKHTVFWWSYAGLRKVPFRGPYEQFAEKYKKANDYSHKKTNPMVTTNIKEVIQKINSSDIRMHHQSCAAELRYDIGKNSALCIHFQGDPEDSIAIPGIEYILSKRAQREIAKEEKRRLEFSLL